MILYPGHCSEARGVGVEGAQERERENRRLKKESREGKNGKEEREEERRVKEGGMEVTYGKERGREKKIRKKNEKKVISVSL